MLYKTGNYSLPSVVHHEGHHSEIEYYSHYLIITLKVPKYTGTLPQQCKGMTHQSSMTWNNK